MPAFWEVSGLQSKGHPTPKPSKAKRFHRHVKRGRTKEGGHWSGNSWKKGFPRGWFLEGIGVDLMQM